MADVYSVFGTLLALGIAFPGLLVAFWLFYPQQVDEAASIVGESLLRCLGSGALASLGVGLPVVVLTSIPSGVSNLLAGVLVIGSLGIATLGAAGIALVLGKRLSDRSGEVSPARAFLLGAIAFEMAAAFPVLGWFGVVPVTLFASFGVALRVLFRRRKTIPGTAPIEA